MYIVVDFGNLSVFWGYEAVADLIWMHSYHWIFKGYGSVLEAGKYNWLVAKSFIWKHNLNIVWGYFDFEVIKLLEAWFEIL